MSETTTFARNLRDQTTRSTAYAAEQAQQQAASFAQFGEMGVGNVKAALRLQTEMFDVLHDISRNWVARVTSEAEHAFGLPNKLSAAQSMPDAMSVYHEWLNEWMNMCNEDSRRLVADGQRIMDKGVRCFTPTSTGATT